MSIVDEYHHYTRYFLLNKKWECPSDFLSPYYFYRMRRRHRRDRYFWMATIAVNIINIANAVIQALR